MTHSKLANDASSSAQGTIYQLYVAVQKCFEMTAGQQVIVERYGDVTVSASQQLEVKHYDDPLTDSHINFWKTLHNWMRDDFNEGDYSALVLCTTQRIGEHSSLKNWNAASATERVEILDRILKDGESREQRRLETNHEQAQKPPESLRHQRLVMEPERHAKLQRVVERFVIADLSPDLGGLYARLKDVHSKHILQAKRDDYLCALLGFVICPSVVIENSWRIGFDDFSAKVQDLTAQYCKGTTRFPVKYLPLQESLSSDVTDAARNKLFVDKIHDIDYHDVIRQAISDYLYASNTVLKELREYEVPISRYEVFANEVLQQFEPSYRKALRRVKDVVRDSQDFYDSMMVQAVPSFSGFETPYPSFRNGVIHMHCDDTAKNLKWRLEDA